MSYADEQTETGILAPPAPPLNPAKVLSYATRGFANPRDEESFAATVYQDYFDQRPGTSLADMTRMVHGEELTPAAAVKNLVNWYTPVVPKTEPKAVELRQQILEGEAGVPKSVRVGVRLAVAASDRQRMDSLFRRYPEFSSQIMKLSRAYEDAYGKPMFAPGTTAAKVYRLATLNFDPTGIVSGYLARHYVGPAIEAVRRKISGYEYLGKQGLSTPFSGFGLYGTLQELGIDPHKPLTEADTAKIEQDFLQRANRLRPSPTMDEEENPSFTPEDAKKYAAMVPALLPGAVEAYNAERARYLSERALAPSSLGKNPVTRAIEAAGAFGPDMALMTAATFAGVPEVIPLIAAGMTVDLERELMFDYGLPQQHARALVAPVAAIYAFGSELLPVFGKAATEKVTSSILGEFAKNAGKKTFHTTLALNLFAAADNAAKSIALSETGRSPEIPDLWRNQLHEFLQSVMNAVILAGPQAGFDTAAAIRRSSAPPTQNGDAAHLEAAKLKERELGLSPDRVPPLSVEPFTADRQAELGQVVEEGRLEKAARIAKLDEKPPLDVAKPGEKPVGALRPVLFVNDEPFYAETHQKAMAAAQEKFGPDDPAPILALADESEIRFQDSTGKFFTREQAGGVHSQELKVAKPKPLAAPATSFGQATTGRPFTMRLLRGSGRADSPYSSQVPQEPVLGPGRWTTPSREFAMSFGPNVTSHDVALSNPLVVRTDAEWRSLTTQAGWKYPNPFGQDVTVTSAGIARLRSLLERAGYDGVIIDPSERGDEAKTLMNVFGEKQVVEFNASSTPAGTEKSGPVPETNTGRSENRLVTDEAYEAAAASLREKMGRASAGADPTILKELGTMLVYHVERGVRTFAAFSKLAIEKLGEAVKPFLAQVWDAYHAENPDLRLKPAPTHGDAAVELGTRLLVEDNFTTEKMKAVIEENFPNAPIGKTVAEARMLAAGIGDTSGLSPTAITRKLREAEIGLRVDEGTAAKLKDLAKTTAAKLKAEAAMKQRMTAEDVLSKVSGTDYLTESEQPRTIRKIVEEAFRSGYKAGKKTSTPLNTIAFQALNKKDASLKLRSREERQGSYEDDLARIRHALNVIALDPMQGEKTATAKMVEMFGGQEAKDVRRLMHEVGVHELKDMFSALQREYETRLKGMFAEDIVRGFLKLKAGQQSLTPSAVEALKALRSKQAPLVDLASQAAGSEAGDLNFHVEQLIKLGKARAKLQMYQNLLDEGRMTPADFEQKAKLVSGFKSGLLEFFRNESLAGLQELRNELGQIFADSRQEQYNIASGKLVKKSADADVIRAEAEQNSKQRFFVNDRAWRGLFRDLNVDSRLLAQKLGGVGRGSRALSVLHDYIFEKRNVADSEKARLHNVYEDGLSKLGVTRPDRVRWGTDRRTLKIGGQALNATTMELLHLYVNLKSPWTEHEAAKAEALKSVIDRARDYGWRPSGADSVEQLKQGLNEALDSKQKAVGDLIFEVFNDKQLREDLNKSSMWRNGVAAYTDETYSPLIRDKQGAGKVETLEDVAKGGFKSLEVWGSGKARVTNRNPILLENAETLLFRHVHEATRQAHLLIPIGEAKAVLSEPKLRSATIDRLGRDGYDRLLTSYADIAGVGKVVNVGPIIRWLNRGQMVSALWGNFVSQMNARAQASELTAGLLINDYGPGAAVGFLKRSDLHLSGPLFFQNKENAAVRDMFVASDPRVANGYFIHRWSLQPMEILTQLANPGELGREGDQLSANATNYTLEMAKHYGRKVERLGMQGYQNGDMKVAVATYRYLTEDRGLTPQAALAKTIDYVRDSQPPSSPFDYTKGYTALRPFWLLFPFLGAESRSAALVAREYTGITQARTPAEKTTAVKRLGTVVLSTALQAATATAVAGARAALVHRGAPDKDRKTHPYWKALLKTFTELNAPIGRMAETFSDLILHGEGGTPAPIRDAQDIRNGAAVLIEAWQHDQLDLDDPKQAKAFQKMLSGLSGFSRLPLRSLVNNYKLAAGGAE